MVDTISIPADDKFQILADVPKGDLVYDGNYQNIARTDALVVIQITLNAGRTVDAKRKLYARIAELLKQKAGVRPEDVLISLVETTKENWSFGNGLATYAKD
jgi:phenylpyruvate tautomerase PptA (4-oxalocrotonate tautomerase family)